MRKNQSNINLNLERILSLLKISKTLLPNNSFFFFFFFLLKFSGLIIFASVFEINSSNLLSAHNLFGIMTYYYNFSRGNANIQHYSSLGVIYILLLIPLILWLNCICFKKRMPNTKVTEEKINYWVVITIKIITSLYLLIIIFSQHLIEYLCLPFCLLIPNKSIKDKGIASRLTQIENNLSLGVIPLIIINCFFILLINVYVMFFFIWFNSPFLSNHFRFKFFFNIYFIFLLLLIFNYQGFHYYSYLHDSNKVIMTIIALVSSIPLLFIINIKYIHPIYLNYLLLSFILYSFWNSVISLISHYTNTATDQFISKNFIIALLILSNLFFKFYFQTRFLNKIVIHNLFINNKVLNKDYLYHLTSLLQNAYNDPSSFSKILCLIEENQALHKSNNQTSLETKGSFFSNLSHQFKTKKLFVKEGNQARRRTLFKQQFSSFLVLIETEIVNFISEIYKLKKINSHVKIFLLHCDYISYFKLNYSLSLYLIHQYLSKICNVGFKYTIYFYSLKNILLMDRRKKTLTTDKSKNKYLSFLQYFQVISNIKELVNQTCSDYLNVLSLKTYFCEGKKQKERVKNNSMLELLFSNCLTINESLRQIKKLIIDNFAENNLKTPEMCYLIRHFYNVTHKKIPNSILSCMINISAYSSIQRFDSDFLDQKFDHPIILFMDYNNGNNHQENKGNRDCKIYYISQKFSNLLGYKGNELIGQDCHILIPSEFAEQHTIEMKKKLFISERTKPHKKPFAITKDRYYIKIELVSSLLPSLAKNTLIISNISLRPQDETCYLFVTDIETNVITMTKNFSDKFKINFQMINRLNITVGSFFNLNTNKISKDFKHNIQAINDIKKEPIDNILNVFSTNSFVNLYDEYDKDTKIIEEDKRKKGFNHKDLIINLVQKKRKLISNLQKVKKQIEELEYDTNWLRCISALEDNFHKGGKLRNSYDFEIQIKLYSIGNEPYYYIKVFDKADNIEISPNVEDKREKLLQSIQQSTIEINYMKNFYTNYQKISGLNSSHNITASMLNESQNALINSSMNTKNKPNNIINNKTGLSNFISTVLNEINPKQIKEFNRNYNMRSLILSVFVIILMIIIELLLIISLVLKSIYLDEIKTLYDIVFNALKLRGTLLETALLMTSGVFRLDGLEPITTDNIELSDEVVKNQLYIRSIEMFDYFNDYRDLINQHYSDLRDLIELFTKEREFERLNNDFTVNYFNSTFEKEFNYYHFNCGYRKREESLKECNIKEHFLGRDTPLTGGIANEDEQFLYYITNNIPKVFIVVLCEIIKQGNDFVISKCIEREAHFFVKNITVLVIGFFLIISINSVVLTFISKLKFYFKIFLLKNNNVQLVKSRISLFQKMLESFEEDTCNNFEAKFNNNSNRDNTVDMINNAILINSNNIDSGSTSNKRDPKKAFELLQKMKLRDKKNQKDKNRNVKSNQRKEQEDEDEDEERALYDSFSIFSLRMLILYLVLMVFAILFFLGLILGNIVIDTDIFTTIQLVKEMAYAYIDIVACRNAVLFYYRVSVLYNNINFITIPFNEFDKYIFKFTLAPIQVDINDQRFTILHESGMAFYYYSYLSEQIMVEYFEKSTNKNLLPKRKQFGKSINSDSGSCKNVGEAYNKYYNKEIDLFDSKLLENACLSLEQGIGDKGLLITISHYLSYLFDEYIDFALEKIPDLVNDIQAPFFISTLRMMYFMYNVIWHITLRLTKEDIDWMFIQFKIKEQIFQLLLLGYTLFIDILFTLYLFLVLRKMINSFVIIINKLKEEL